MFHVGISMLICTISVTYVNKHLNKSPELPQRAIASLHHAKLTVSHNRHFLPANLPGHHAEQCSKKQPPLCAPCLLQLRLSGAPLGSAGGSDTAICPGRHFLSLFVILRPSAAGWCFRVADTGIRTTSILPLTSLLQGGWRVDTAAQRTHSGRL